MSKTYEIEWLGVIALSLLLVACGDDSRPISDTGTPPSDTGTATDTGGGGDASEDTGGGGDAIPTITADCDTANCMAATSGNVLLAYISPDCAAIFDDMIDSSVAAGVAAPYSCTAGTCTATSDDATEAWADEAEATVTSIAAGSYGITAWFDHNGNFAMGGGPDAGDTFCCFDAPVDASTTSLTVESTSCMDL